MSSTIKRKEQTQVSVIRSSLLKEVTRSQRVREHVGVPKVLIRGDIRLRVSKSYAANRPVKGHYYIETEGMNEPSQVIWIIEGKVLNHTVRSLDVEFDVRGIPAGGTLTRVLAVQVIEANGQECIVHSSVFVQIHVVRDDVRTSDSAINALLDKQRRS